MKSSNYKLQSDKRIDIKKILTRLILKSDIVTNKEKILKFENFYKVKK